MCLYHFTIDKLYAVISRHSKMTKSEYLWCLGDEVNFQVNINITIQVQEIVKWRTESNQIY